MTVLVQVAFAPLSLTSLTGRPSGLVSWGQGDAHVTLGYDRFGRPSAEMSDGPRDCQLVADTPLALGRWVRLALFADGTELRLLVDGRTAASCPWSGPMPAGTPIVGRRSDQPDDADESCCGQLTDVEVVGDLDDARRRIMLGPPQRPDLDVVAELRALRGQDPNRPEYHFMPPAHWMNEPHAPIQVDGVHHLFYQANRRGPFWGAIEWGHAISKDLVHWTHLPPALTPDRTSVAPDGVWSGSSVLSDEGGPLLYFTAGDFGRTPDQSVALARPSGDDWIADATPLVEMPDDPDLVAGQFRDPFVWREAAGWFMLVGAGVVDRGGTALLYGSPDGRSWTSYGRLLVGDRSRHPETGEMWELPVLLPIGQGRHVFLVCPWWQERPADQVVEVVHWIGRWDPASATFTPDHPEPRRFDVGRHFTGPSGTVLDDGRTILWSIAQDGRTPQAQRSGGWAHNAGLPIELGLAGERLTIRPVRELESLRTEPLDPGQIGGMTFECEVTADAAAGPLVVSLSIAGQLALELTIDATDQLVRLHRPGAAAYDVWRPDEYDEGPVPVTADDVRLRLFVDHSMVEAYVGDHTNITTRIDVRDGEPELTISTPYTSCRAWRLAGADN